MIRLTATVKNTTGNTRHWRAVTDGSERRIEDAGAAVRVEIVEEDSGIFLLRFDSLDVCIADTWHENIKAAKEQAAFEYGLTEGDWQALD